jgi:uncharacterized protein (DUF427 family)
MERETRRESAWGKVPGYRVDLEPAAVRIRVRFAGETIVDTRRPLRVLETRHAPVWYLPREDARTELLEKGEYETFCPFKGEAAHYDVVVGDRRAERAVWSYESPFDEVSGLKGYLAFYPDRVDEISEEPA